MLTGIIVLICLFFVMKAFDLKEDNGFIYPKYSFAHKNAFGSLPNPRHLKRGYIWTPVNILKKKFKKEDKKTVFIDNFSFDEDFAEKSGVSKRRIKIIERTELYFDPLKMTQGILLIGKMGAGKTEMIIKIINQKFYNRAVIHQVKAGDFAETFLRKRDMLFSPYDKRGYLWDILNEDEGIIKTFFENYANAVQGDGKKDFFSAAANRLYNEMAIKIRTKYKNESSAKKWLLLIKAVKDLFAEMEGGSQNSKKDIKSTMEAILEPLEIMAFKMQDPKQKSFIIKDFFAKKNQTRLILDNIPEYEKSLTPLFTAFTACMSQIHTSLPDSKTDFTLYALDEYLSMLSIMDEASKKRLHTLIRSKAGILMPGIQYVPIDDKKLQQLLTSSAYAWFFFSGIDNETINLLRNTIGDTEYSYQEESTSRDSKGKKSRSYSTKHEKTNLIYNLLINGLGDEYSHITYLPNHTMLYKGYSPQANLKKIAKKSVPVDLDEFYKLKYIKDNEPEEDIKNLTFADLFKEKPLSKLEEYRLFKKFEKLKQNGDANEMQNFKQDNNLIDCDLEFLFKKYMQNKVVVNEKMKMFSKDQRFELFKTWTEIKSKNDQAKELEFIEEHDLFGALPSFFYFDSEDELLGEI